MEGDIHFSELVGPVTFCEWWSRINGVRSEIYILAKRWELQVDRTWNE